MSPTMLTGHPPLAAGIGMCCLQYPQKRSAAPCLGFTGLQREKEGQESPRDHMPERMPHLPVCRETSVSQHDAQRPGVQVLKPWVPHSSEEPPSVPAPLCSRRVYASCHTDPLSAAGEARSFLSSTGSAPSCPLPSAHLVLNAPWPMTCSFSFGRHSFLFTVSSVH